MRCPYRDVVISAINHAVQIPRRHCPCLQSFRHEIPSDAVQLRCNPQRQLSFSRIDQLWRAFEGCVQPAEQIAVDEQLVAQQRRQIRQGPPECRHQLQKGQDQHSDQRCPDLGFDCIGVRADEGLIFRFCLIALKNSSTFHRSL